MLEIPRGLTQRITMLQACWDYTEAAATPFSEIKSQHPECAIQPDDKSRRTETPRNTRTSNHDVQIACNQTFARDRVHPVTRCARVWGMRRARCGTQKCERAGEIAI